jgi:hypothetical protein
VGAIKLKMKKSVKDSVPGPWILKIGGMNYALIKM